MSSQPYNQQKGLWRGGFETKICDKSRHREARVTLRWAVVLAERSRLPSALLLPALSTSKGMTNAAELLEATEQSDFADTPRAPMMRRFACCIQGTGFEHDQTECAA